MRRFLFILVLFLFITSAYADEFRIPFPCFPKQLQARFAEYNRKLDLDGNDRTKDSWGFIENKGTRFIIYTYYSATEEDLNIIMAIVNRRTDE